MSLDGSKKHPGQAMEKLLRPVQPSPSAAPPLLQSIGCTFQSLTQVSVIGREMQEGRRVSGETREKEESSSFLPSCRALVAAFIKLCVSL